jgi:hypothetical protein
MHSNFQPVNSKQHSKNKGMKLQLEITNKNQKNYFSYMGGQDLILVIDQIEYRLKFTINITLRLINWNGKK